MIVKIEPRPEPHDFTWRIVDVANDLVVESDIADLRWAWDYCNSRCWTIVGEYSPGT